MSSAAREQLLGVGLRVTAPRIAVLEALNTRPGHLTVEEVRLEVLGRLGSVSVQAIYDVLRALSESGLIRCLETPGHPARYEGRVGDNHHHFVCTQCGTTLDVDCSKGEPPCIEPAALPGGFVVTEAEVTYWGQCSSCATANQSPTN